ncbi:MAG: DUF2076 domain-containing protein [Alphaproteobacteria bacterium]|nr:DUF2076 family protein [Alphaproteobacteria bacterium]TAD90167.1 MAG: DUF2076 domain-containing protein [Alphaproteobacteria bacterium]
MTPEERALISGLFDRLRAVQVDRDPEAERFIHQQLQANPAAPYLLVQAAVVQEHALREAQDKIRELEQRAAPAPATSAGFTGGGAWAKWGASAAPAAPAPAPAASGPWGQRAAPAAGPWGQAPHQGMQQPQRGGFLRTALATAAGVAGGALLFQGLSGMFGGGAAQAATPTDPGATEPQAAQDTGWEDQGGGFDGGGFDGGGDGGGGE